MERLRKGSIARLPAEAIRNDTWLQRICLSWVYRIVNLGRSGKLLPKDLRMPHDQATEVSFERFDKQWQAEVATAGKGGKASLARALWRAFGGEFALAGLFKLLWGFFVLMGAFYFVRTLVDFVGSKDMQNELPNRGVGWVLSGAFFVDAIFIGLALQRMSDVSVRLGIKVRAALMTSVFRKTFRLSGSVWENAGNPVSLVATDCIKLYEGVQHCQNVWTAPLETAAIIGLLLSLTRGVYGLPALGVIVFVLPLQYYFGYLIAKYKMANVNISDSRVVRMHEILLAIKLVKFYVWERSFAKQVEEVRTKELHLIGRAAIVKTLNLCVVFVVPPMIALVIFATYVSEVGELKPTFAFVVLSLFNTLRLPLVVLPKALRGVSEAAAAVKRLQEFLLLPERDPQVRSSQVEVSFKDAVLSHPSAPEEFKLHVPKFEVKTGEVVALVGRVGVGKSSLLQAILGTMHLERGELRVGGEVGYVLQTPWVQNLSVRDNILFGLPYEEARYQEVIHACALELDLQILPKGDSSMAGERGINLSGGQRQRVSLARAVYHHCDLLLLDNPLSAVDQHTSKHIFEKCVKGMLRDKAVVLVAHQLELLPECDKVAIMDGGRVVYFGPYDPEALNQHMPVDHMLHATVEGGEAATHKAQDDKKKTEDALGGAKSKQGPPRRSKKLEDSPSGSPKLTTHPGDLDPCTETPEEIRQQFSGHPVRMTPSQASFYYWQAGGLVLGLFTLLVFMTTQTVRILSDLHIRYWASDYYDWLPANSVADPAKEDEGNRLYLLSYMGYVVAFFLLLLLRDGIFSVWSIRASTRLHNQLFSRVLKAPFLFFLRTPVGDVLNSFAKDQDILDEALPDTIHMTGIYLMILCTSLAIVTVSIYYYAIMTGALFAAFFMMQYIYLPAATVLKRWAGESANQIFVHIDESLQGMDLIRAFGAEDFFMQENVQRINEHHLAMFNTEQTHLWLAFWCDFFGALLVVATCLFSVGMTDQLGPAAVGLAISNSIQVLVFFTWVVRGVADSVSMWDAVERVTTYANNIPTEQLSDSGKTITLPHRPRGRSAEAEKARDQSGIMVQVDTSPLDSWPAHGDLRFEGVCLRYFPGAPLAIKHVTFHIKDQEKIGVVGRTGSGKTTMLMALFRMFDLARGRIILDGMDIATLPLQDVRRRIAIIPQEPAMFKGTVRSNLDPFGLHSDLEIWQSLEMVGLKDSVSELPGCLECHVSEGGSNFSLGQKQLICLARCVLKKTKVLVLDEATAAMDLQTDAMIQRTIRRAFKERTTVTIAHRLDTIIFSDKILAMSKGELKEFDEPSTLLADPDSMFSKLVNDAGPVASAMLKNMAREGPQDDD